ncbi:hypothetical protein N7512_006776 [Penicillium capsulatum]|nr:hypothetical protein N7512_006776 [Penicillium capsulatum]
MLGIRVMLSQGENAGQLIDKTKDKGPGSCFTSIVHRAAFLRELLAANSPEWMHASKKLDKLDWKDDGSLTLHFTDDSTHECDTLIGADFATSFSGRKTPPHPRETQALWVML